jgi:acyl-CoA thioesterase
MTAPTEREEGPEDQDGEAAVEAGGEPNPLHDRLDDLFRADPLSARLGARLVRWQPGFAEVVATPGPELANFLGTVHGGAVFSLADIAFAVANNSWGRMGLALSVDVQYVRAATPGVALRAVARERSRTRRNATYALRVEEAEGERALVASFQALGYRTDRWHFGEDAWPPAWREKA